MALTAPHDALHEPDLAVHVEDLTVSYRGKPVLWDIDVDIPPGVMAAVVGPNGAGKSTLIKAILGLVPPTAGHVTIHGRPYRAQRRRVGYVPQRSTVDWDFPTTAIDVVTMGLYGRLGWLRRPGRRERAQAREALDMVGMAGYADRQISQLSGGQQQRVFLARALVQEADVYFLDEPMAGVDATTERAIVDILHRLRHAGKTVVVVHHDLETVSSYFDWMLILNVRAIAQGRVADVYTAENLRKAYGGQMARLEAWGVRRFRRRRMPASCRSPERDDPARSPRRLQPSGPSPWGRRCWAWSAACSAASRCCAGRACSATPSPMPPCRASAWLHRRRRAGDRQHPGGRAPHRGAGRAAGAAPDPAQPAQDRCRPRHRAEPVLRGRRGAADLCPGHRGRGRRGGLDSFLFGQAAALCAATSGSWAESPRRRWPWSRRSGRSSSWSRFDPGYAGSLGLPVVALEVTLTVMIALAVVVGLQMVGVVLMAAMVIAPAVAAPPVGRHAGAHGRPRRAVIGVASGVVGAVLSAVGPRARHRTAESSWSVSTVRAGLACRRGRAAGWSGRRRNAPRDRRRLRRHQAFGVAPEGRRPPTLTAAAAPPTWPVTAGSWPCWRRSTARAWSRNCPAPGPRAGATS